MTTSDQGAPWPYASSDDEAGPEASPELELEPSRRLAREAEAALLDTEGPPPAVWAAIEATLRREGRIACQDDPRQ